MGPNNRYKIDVKVGEEPIYEEQDVWFETKPAWDEQVLVKDAYEEQILVREAYDERNFGIARRGTLGTCKG